MKPNEAPKKVYLHLTTGNRLLNGKYYEYKPAKIRFNDKIIEYIHKDAFVKKACKFIKDNGSHYIDIVNGQLVLKKSIIKDFKKYMEE